VSSAPGREWDGLQIIEGSDEPAICKGHAAASRQHRSRQHRSRHRVGRADQSGTFLAHSIEHSHELEVEPVPRNIFYIIGVVVVIAVVLGFLGVL
jgi:hypothetical protein